MALYKFAFTITITESQLQQHCARYSTEVYYYIWYSQNCLSLSSIEKKKCVWENMWCIWVMTEWVMNEGTNNYSVWLSFRCWHGSKSRKSRWQLLSSHSLFCSSWLRMPWLASGRSDDPSVQLISSESVMQWLLSDYCHIPCNVTMAEVFWLLIVFGQAEKKNSCFDIRWFGVLWGSTGSNY